MNSDTAQTPVLSIVKGTPLSDEIGDRPQTIPGYFREVTSRYADREALVMHMPDAVIRWSYNDLRRHAEAVARSLAASGVGRDSRVGILMTNRPEFLAAVFGVALAGGVAVPLSTFATAAELEYLLQASAVHTLLLEPEIAGRDFAKTLLKLEPEIADAEPGRLASGRFPFLRCLAGTGTVSTRGIEGWQDFLHRGADLPREILASRGAATSPADTAVLFFSSGSTGRPKGILHNQRAVVIQWYRWPRTMGFSGDLRVWTANGFFWSGQFAMAMGPALSTGGTLVLQSAFDADEALELIQKEQVNVPLAMPHQWGKIAAAPAYQEADLSSLTYLDLQFSGLKHPTLKSDYLTPQAFGCTETLTINTQIPVGDPRRNAENHGHGLPLPGNTLKIVDPMSGAILPRSQRGEIAIKGPTLMSRYLDKNPGECLDEEGFFHTGDGGYVDDTGWLFWEGRLNDIIKTGGANVSPVEIDELIQTFPGVKATQTVGVPHDTLGEMVVACVVPLEGATVEEKALQEFLREHLASYKVPRRVLILGDEDLSVIGSGAKIRTAEVREVAAKRLSGEKGH